MFLIKQLFHSRLLDIYYLQTVSEVITGKSQTEALMYWPSDSEVNTKAPVWDFPVSNDWTDEVKELFTIWLFNEITI